MSTDQQSTDRQNLVLDEAGIEDPVVFEEDPGTSSRLHPLQRPKSGELLTARPGDTVHISEMFRLVRAAEANAALARDHRVSRGAIRTAVADLPPDHTVIEEDAPAPELRGALDQGTTVRRGQGLPRVPGPAQGPPRVREPGQRTHT